MKRSDFLIKLVSFIVFIAIAIYIGYSFYLSHTNPFKTTLAIGMTINESIESEGYIVRQENVISAGSGSVSIAVSNGDKVAKGQRIAMEYSGSTAIERANEIRELRLEIESLESLQSGTAGAQSAQESVLELNRVISSKDLSDLPAAMFNVDAYIISGSGRSDNETEIHLSELRDRLDLLTDLSVTGMETIEAEYSGTFSSMVDGYEHITPEDLEGLKPEDYTALFKNKDKILKSHFGKLISGIKWYYVTVVNSASAKKLDNMKTVTLNFSKTYSASHKMNIESVGRTVNGKSVVVFSCDKSIQNVASLREASAEIVFSEQSGIAVPKEAVHLSEDGVTFVYILKGMRSDRVDITILNEDEDRYMVESGNSGLREDDQIIVRANNLYDGAVVID